MPTIQHRTHPLRRLATAAATALTLLLAACGGGGGDGAAPEPAATEVAPGQSRTLAIGGAGGSLVLATREGATFTLSVPAGAVPAGTTLSLETVTATSRQRFQLRLGPAGLQPAEPLTLTIALPATLALPMGAVLSYDGTPLAYTRGPDGRIELRLLALAGTAASGSEDGRARALASAARARPLADAPAHTCASAPVPDFGDGTLTAGDPIEADVYGQCMLGAVNQLARDGDFAGAVRLASALGAYLQSLGVANTNGLADRFTLEARRLACIAQGEALDRAAAITIDDFADLVDTVRPLLFWQAAVEQLGAACPGIVPTRTFDLVQQLTDDALRHFATREGAVVNAEGVEYTEAVQALRDPPRLQSQLRSLAAPPAVQALAREQLRERAEPAIVDAVLQAPWQRCRERGEYDKLAELLGLVGDVDAIKTAAQYCGTQLGAQALSATGVETAALTPPLGGVAARSQRTNGSLVVAADGRLRLAGPLRALGCPAGRSGGSESLEIRFNGHLVRTLSVAPHLSSALEIGVGSLLDAAGIRAADFRSGTLTLHRSGSPCDGAWGEAPSPLLTLDLSGGVCLPPAGQDHCVTVLAELDDPRRAFRYAHAISDQGAHVSVAGDPRASGGPGMALWHRSGVVEVPEDFMAWFGTLGSPLAVADDGTVAGLEYVANASGGFVSFTPATFRRSGARVTKLLAQPVLAHESLPQPNWSWFRVTRDLTTMTISPQGRVHFTILETGEPWADSDLGYCGLVTLTTGTGWDCDRHTLYEQDGGSGLANTRQTRRSPHIGDLQFPMFDGGSGVGLVGFIDRLVAVDSVFGGVAGYRRAQDPREMRDLAPLASGAAGQVLAADRSGRLLTQRGDIVLEPASGAVPAGWTLGALGLNGHLQACAADQSVARLIDLADGRTRMTVTRGDTVMHAGRRIEVYSDCRPGARAVDGLGRMLGEGWVETAAQTVPLIFTPAGVPLP